MNRRHFVGRSLLCAAGTDRSGDIHVCSQRQRRDFDAGWEIGPLDADLDATRR
jgi:hypothetical protein